MVSMLYLFGSFFINSYVKPKADGKLDAKRE